MKEKILQLKKNKKTTLPSFTPKTTSISGDAPNTFPMLLAQSCRAVGVTGTAGSPAANAMATRWAPFLKTANPAPFAEILGEFWWWRLPNFVVISKMILMSCYWEIPSYLGKTLLKESMTLHARTSSLRCSRSIPGVSQHELWTKTWLFDLCTKKSTTFCAMDFEIHSPPIYKSIINTEFHAMGIQDVQGPLFFHGSYGGRFLWGI